MFSSVVLFSGGIDSFVLLEYVRKCIDPNTQPVFFNIKLRYNDIELQYVAMEKSCIVDCSLYLGDVEKDDAFIPNRNILLTTLAVSKYSNKVFIGSTKSDRISDNNEKVFNDLSLLLTQTDGKNVISITSPFWSQYKEDIIKWYVEHVDNGINNLYTDTFSCYNPLKEAKVVDSIMFTIRQPFFSNHCYSCPACFRRNAALSSVGATLPFYNNSIVKKYKDEFSSKQYLDDTDKRAINTLKYIKKLEEI